MRVSRAKAEENRETVISAASKLFRERGFDGIGLNELMAAANLTHGGFYKQFDSKDDLMVQASTNALDGTLGVWAKIESDSSDNAFQDLVNFYLSTENRDRVGDGCAFAALGADAARRGPKLRQAFQTGMNKHLSALENLISSSPNDTTRDETISLFSSMLGALLMARIVKDDGLSERILSVAKNAILERASGRGNEQTSEIVTDQAKR